MIQAVNRFAAILLALIIAVAGLDMNWTFIPTMTEDLFVWILMNAIEVYTIVLKYVLTFPALLNVIVTMGINLVQMEELVKILMNVVQRGMIVTQKLKDVSI